MFISDAVPAAHDVEIATYVKLVIYDIYVHVVMSTEDMKYVSLTRFLMSLF